MIASDLYDPLPPRKQYFRVSEIVPRLAQVLDVSNDAARMRIYRGLCNGEVHARCHLGTIRIPREEVIRILEGEPIEDISSHG